MQRPSDPPGPAAPHDGASARAPLALLLLATALVYLPALPGEFVWDDQSLIVDNPNVRDPTRLLYALTHDFWHVPTSLETAGDLGRRYYRPVVTLAYWLQVRAFGLAPLGFHLVNLALHLACVALAFGWLRRRVEAVAPAPVDARGLDLAALLGAAVFALHPSRPESVAWISGSTDLWLTLFGLLGLRAWDVTPGRRGAVATAGFFALALLCKETALVLPVVLLTDLLVLRAPGAPLRPALTRWAVAASGTALALVLRVSVVRAQVPRSVFDRWDQTPERVLSTLGHYLWEVAMPWWPSVQGVVRVMVAGRTVFDRGSIALGAAALVGLAGLVVWAWRRPAARPWLADAAWFTIALLPTLNLVPMGLTCQTASRFLYLPMLALCAALVRALARLRGGRAELLRAGVGALALAMGVVSARHAATFVDNDALWTAEARRHPHNHYAHILLASAAVHRGDYQAAEGHVFRAHVAAVRNGAGDEAVRTALMAADLLITATPDDDPHTLTAARDFLDAFATGGDGFARLHTRRIQLGLRLRREELAMRQRLRVDDNRGWVRFRLGDLAGAEGLLREAARRPHAFTARRRLALVLAGRGAFAEADATLAAMLRDNPTDGASAGARGMLRAYADALAHAGDDVARRSVEARLWTDLSRPQRAREIVRPLVASHPARPEPAEALVYAELADGRLAAAEAVARDLGQRTPALAPRLRAMLPTAR